MWKKKGLVFDINRYKSEYIVSHASIPFALQINGNLYRIYFSSRNKEGKSLPYYIEAIVTQGELTITGLPVGPLLDLGELGSFDDSGIMPSCLVKFGNKIYMYYIGWNPQVTVSYRLSIGLAISEDGGDTFVRHSNGPICDRGIEEPYFNTAPFVIQDDAKWKMWYISCTKWQIINNYPEPSYHVKYAESMDGIHWIREGTICIDYDDHAKAIGRPCIIKNNDEYIMYFSYRDIVDYRTQKGKGYQIGLAISKDGKKWVKKYEDTQIALSEDGWDSVMMEYCHVFCDLNGKYMLYNGNDFGKDGFGYAFSK